MWRNVETDPPKMEYFASAEDIELNRHTNGLWVPLVVSNTDDQTNPFLASVSIDFDNNLKWESRYTETLSSQPIASPKWWRKDEEQGS